jgi:RNA polymerase sigma-70 factor (ECF subfamily)
MQKMHRDAQRQSVAYGSKIVPHLQALPKERGRNRRGIGRCFYTILPKLDQLKVWRFEAWSRKITVNHCLATIKKTPISICILMISKLFRNLLLMK